MDGGRLNDDVHGGYTCAEVEEFCDDAQGDLNMISEMLCRRGYMKLANKRRDLVDWVGDALDEPLLPLLKRRAKRKIKRLIRRIK